MNRFLSYFVGLILTAAGNATIPTIRAPLKYRRDLPTIPGSPGGRSSRVSIGPLESGTLIELIGEEDGHTLVLRDQAGGELLRHPGIDLQMLLPRLGYPRQGPVDSTAALTLRLAEFSRIGIRYPISDSAFADQVTLVNNCLEPGLWELALRSPQGGRTRAWFHFPKGRYLALVAKSLGSNLREAQGALRWSEDRARLRLNRLRSRGREVSQGPAELDRSFAFQAQDTEQARKLRKGMVSAGPTYRPGPLRLSDLRQPVHFSDFIPPGRYLPYPTRAFDMSFLLEPGMLHIWETRPVGRVRRERYFEVTLSLGRYRLVIGNLEEAQLRTSSGVRVHGLGVGVPGPRELLAQRIRDAEAPPIYAFLTERDGDSWFALNSHVYGIETLDLRIVGSALELIVGSFERMVSLVRLRGPAPEPVPQSTMTLDAQDNHRGPRDFGAPRVRNTRNLPFDGGPSLRHGLR